VVADELVFDSTVVDGTGIVGEGRALSFVGNSKKGTKTKKIADDGDEGSHFQTNG
jgi:hypothetical protein